MLVLTSHEVNPSDYAARRASLHRSDAVPIRDTPEGYRYLKPNDRAEGPAIRSETSAATRIPTVIVGVLVDPNITQPLAVRRPELHRLRSLRHGHAVQRVLRRRLRSGRLERAVAWRIRNGSSPGAHSPSSRRYHDRVFVDGHERYAENLLQRPARADVALVRPLSPRVSLRLGTTSRTRASTAPNQPMRTFRFPRLNGRMAFAWN